MKQQKDAPKSPLIGKYVESKLRLKRLIKKMKSAEGELQEMASEFEEYGGIIINVDAEDNLLIELNSGKFWIPNFFIKKVK